MLGRIDIDRPLLEGIIGERGHDLFGPSLGDPLNPLHSPPLPAWFFEAVQQQADVLCPVIQDAINLLGPATIAQLRVDANQWLDREGNKKFRQTEQEVSEALEQFGFRQPVIANLILTYLVRVHKEKLSSFI